jgi:hypothetical protein
LLDVNLKLDKCPAQPGNSNMSSSISFLLSLLLIFANCLAGIAQSPSYNGQSYNVNPSQPSRTQPFPYDAQTPNVAPGPPPGNWSNFWQGGAGNSANNENVLGQNIVLTGVLDEDISSKSSKVGDVFAIVLEEGYVASGKVLIPNGSKIIGSVTGVTSAKSLSNGYPGSVQVSLQSLVLPDGSNMPIYAFIDYNPSLNRAPQSKQRNNGIPVAQYGRSITSGLMTSLGSFGTRAGLPVANANYKRAGSEFLLKKGEMLPVRLNRPLDLKQIAPIRINN